MAGHKSQDHLVLAYPDPWNLREGKSLSTGHHMPAVSETCLARQDVHADAFRFFMDTAE